MCKLELKKGFSVLPTTPLKIKGKAPTQKEDKDLLCEKTTLKKIVERS